MKNNVKKTICLVLSIAAVSAIALTGCSNKTGTPANETTTKAETAVETTTKAETAAGTTQGEANPGPGEDEGDPDDVTTAAAQG